MKKNRILSLIFASSVALLSVMPVNAERLTILHTNDTHSQIYPDAKDGRGGVERRKALVDSVRGVEKNVLLIDAGDVVQGSLYFNLYGGELEQKLMNELGYDFRILGNHEFDNGIDSLATVLKAAKSCFLATNYDLRSTPLDGMFDKYAIREFDGRKIGFIAINLDPKGMIAEGNYDGLVYNDAHFAANVTAEWLKKEKKCDMVIAITHIGYNPATPPGDLLLAGQSKDIDIIIGGHSHDFIDPATDKYQWLVANAEGRNVLVTQVGKSGKAVGQIDIDLDNLTAGYKLLQVDARYDKPEPEIAAIIEPYRAGVDVVMRNPVGTAAHDLDASSDELLNWTSDVLLEIGRTLADGVEISIINKGGIRRGLTEGVVTEGEIMTMLPFSNTATVIDIKGKDLLEAFDVMAVVGGNGVSGNVNVTFDPGVNVDHSDAKVISATVDGKPVDPDKTYRVVTIDYLANGGDYMESLSRHDFVTHSSKLLMYDVLDYIMSGAGAGKAIESSTKARMQPSVK